MPLNTTNKLVWQKSRPVMVRQTIDITNYCHAKMDAVACSAIVL